VLARSGARRDCQLCAAGGERRQEDCAGAPARVRAPAGADDAGRAGRGALDGERSRRRVVDHDGEAALAPDQRTIDGAVTRGGDCERHQGHTRTHSALSGHVDAP